MSAYIVFFIVFYLAPGIASIVFARKIIEFNARLYPNLYGGPQKRKIMALITRIVAVVWILVGLAGFRQL